MTLALSIIAFCTALANTARIVLISRIRNAENARLRQEIAHLKSRMAFLEKLPNIDDEELSTLIKNSPIFPTDIHVDHPPVFYFPNTGTTG